MVTIYKSLKKDDELKTLLQGKVNDETKLDNLEEKFNMNGKLICIQRKTNVYNFRATVKRLCNAKQNPYPVFQFCVQSII